MIPVLPHRQIPEGGAEESVLGTLAFEMQGTTRFNAVTHVISHPNETARRYPDIIIQIFVVGSHQYANDAQLFLSFPPNSKGAVEVLDQCVEAVGNLDMGKEAEIKP